MMLPALRNWFTPQRLFTGALVLLLLDRLLVLLLFGFQYTGSDDVLLWNIGHDYAQGIFHEPFMYRQNYNPALESLLAVPLLWLRVPPHIAFPLLTSVLALFPFITFANWFKRKGNYAAGILLLLLPVMLSAHHALLVTLPRGFVTGIFLLGFYPLLDRLANLYLRRMVIGFLFMLALAVNPNVLLLAVPLLVYELAAKKAILPGLLCLAAGALPVVVLHYAALHFYETHPLYKLHALSPEQLQFDGALFVSAWAKRGDLFTDLAPLLPGMGWFIVVAFPLLAFFGLQQKNYGVFIGSILVFVLLLFSCGLPKIHDGSPAVFFHSSRMFLALPLAAFLLLAWLVSNKQLERFADYRILILAILLIGFRGVFVSEQVNTTMQHIAVSPVHERPVSEFCEECDSVYAVAKREKAELIMAFYAPGFELDHAKYVDLGCVLYHPDLPQTIMPEYERRAWVEQKEIKEPAVHERILLFSKGNKQLDSLSRTNPDIRRCCEKPVLYILEGNKQKTLDVFFRVQYKGG